MFDNMRKQNFAASELHGIVVDNLDPSQARRVKVRVSGIHDDVPDEDLPWAACGAFSGRGPHKTASDVKIPRIGAELLVVFQQGDPQNPLYYGGVSSSATVPDVFKVNYPDRSGWLLPNGTLFYVDEKTNTLFVNHQGTTVTIANDGSTTVKAPLLTVDCPETHFTGHLTVDKGITGSQDVVFDGISLKLHHHTEQGVGGPTSQAQA